MLPAAFDRFQHIWCVDFEFTPQEGEPPVPVCLVAHDVRSGRRLRLWEDTLHQLPRPPYTLGSSSLFVAYAAQAELSCHLALGWGLPTYVLDLYAEFHNYSNGLELDHGRSLVGALAYFHLPHLGVGEKASLQKLAARGGPWTAEERTVLLDYCATDVDALVCLLLRRMATRIALPGALLRGRYIRAVALMQHRGLPVDPTLYAYLADQWEYLTRTFIERISPQFGWAYDLAGHFTHKKLLAWADAAGIDWPRTKTGLAVLDKDALKDLALCYPCVEPFRQLRKTLGQMRIHDFPIGRDHRNRFPLWPYGTKTSRNAPPTSQNIMGAASWLRSLLQAPPGHGLAYIDWSQQEYAIAAVLSKDIAMQQAYVSSDPYLALAKMVGAVPPTATKQTHGRIRELYKVVSLAILYGMGPATLARRLGAGTHVAAQLLADHKQAFPHFWEWTQATVDRAIATQSIETVWGWRLRCVSYAQGREYDVNERSIGNFLMQANAGEMLRLACCLATETGIDVCMPVHDALLIQAPLEDLAEAVYQTQHLMAQASALVLNGFTLRTDTKVFPYPDHYFDERGLPMWQLVDDILHTTMAAAFQV